MLGFPVERSGPDAIAVIRIGDVKAVILRAQGASELAIEAFDEGKVQLHVFHPEIFPEGCAGPVPIQARDRFTLTLPDAVLTRVVGARREVCG